MPAGPPWYEGTECRLASEGADLKTIASLLSHSTIVMASRYIPADLQVQRDALARLDRRHNPRSYAGPTNGTERDRELPGSIEVGVPWDCRR